MQQEWMRPSPATDSGFGGSDQPVGARVEYPPPGEVWSDGGSLDRSKTQCLLAGGRAIRGERAGLSEKHGGAIHAEGFAKLLDGVAHQFADIQAMDEEG